MGSFKQRLRRVVETKRERIRFTGNYKSWEEAAKYSTGYGAPEILHKTRAALLKVKAGKAAFERDSVPFDTMQYGFSLLAGLLRAATANHGRLSVLDYGGSLGGTYFQCRAFLSVIAELRWSVVDQPAQVTCGKSDFANDELRFYRTIPECLREQKPNVLLLSGVLQCLPEPYVFLENALREMIPYVIVERTAFNRNGSDRLVIEHVPAWIYEASYPTWFLSESSFRKVFADNYDLICEYVGTEDPVGHRENVVFKGFQFQRRTDQSSSGSAAHNSSREDRRLSESK
jgi:putative methyltransferase (TIGR04325 family)